MADAVGFLNLLSWDIFNFVILK